MSAGDDPESTMRAPVPAPDDTVRLHCFRAQAPGKLDRAEESAASLREFLRLWQDADPGTREVEKARVAPRRLERAGRAARS